MLAKMLNGTSLEKFDNLLENICRKEKDKKKVDQKMMGGFDLPDLRTYYVYGN